MCSLLFAELRKDWKILVKPFVCSFTFTPCRKLKWKYRLDFAFHEILTSETSIENVMKVSLYVLISRTWKCHFATKLKTRVCLSHLIKREWLMFSLRQYCLDFSIFPMFTFHPHLLPTISWWTRNKNDKCLKHMTSSTLVKCTSMIVSIVMPSYPNVTLFLWNLISEHWTTARTINMKINHDIP